MKNAYFSNLRKRKEKLYTLAIYELYKKKIRKIIKSAYQDVPYSKIVGSDTPILV